MKIGEFNKYKGYTGSICYDNNFYYGKIAGAAYFTTYESDRLIGLYDEFKKAVDEYIEFKKELNAKKYN